MQGKLLSNLLVCPYNGSKEKFLYQKYDCYMLKTHIFTYNLGMYY